MLQKRKFNEKNLFLMTMLPVFLIACKAVVDNHQYFALDDQLIGTWEGEYHEKDGAVKRWSQTRQADGSYQIEFYFIEKDGSSRRFVEDGRWWVRSGLFHEKVPSWMEFPDIYQYRLKDNRCVEFLLVDSQESTEDIGQYTFVECLSGKTPSI